MYLTKDEREHFRKLLKTFFRIPYSTDLSGKDAESILRVVRDVQGPLSKRKELFDIVDGDVGYSVKTLKKPVDATRVDLQEQRFGDVDEMNELYRSEEQNANAQGELLLSYMQGRFKEHMKQRGIADARSAILLKNWNDEQTRFHFRYWEKDFENYIENLVEKNQRDEIEWIVQEKGLHGRDKRRQGSDGQNVRLIRMHYKHNQIFTDHDIPDDTETMKFETRALSWDELAKVLSEIDDDIPNPTLDL